VSNGQRRTRQASRALRARAVSQRGGATYGLFCPSHAAGCGGSTFMLILLQQQLLLP
jgi:hypothetical protein